ncbi:hypothetical protein [Pseudomonas chlororaphis]|nr:hypothetical protein [Pseudomonas chlororaphis]MBP5057682.1 hypothetical protein [Pseudomonas chlororaphis]MBP5141443.1 hypothetical protein [Pseudomonas chlororaphis]MBP5142132.1 hypothetical protein [Pseudomonas chlororaphis]MBP5144288.1 hypothetical protein [Pseudomonas chlororaphis]QTT97754.1 hypothetical protein HUT26_28870 [Pseudomonas chlororaphis]
MSLDPESTAAEAIGVTQPSGYLFSRGRNQEVQNKKLLRDYRDFNQYVEIAEVSQDSEMLRTIKIITAYLRVSSA